MKEQNRDYWPMGHIAREWFEVQLEASKEAKRQSCVKMYERHLRQLEDSQNMAQLLIERSDDATILGADRLEMAPT